MNHAPRDLEYERRRAVCLMFSHEETQKSSKGLRNALQSVIILRAGAEVAMQGAMHMTEKCKLFAEKVEAHKQPLFQELQRLMASGDSPLPLPSFVWDAINCSNNKDRKKWMIAPSQNAWKKHGSTVALMRNHIAPLWTKILGDKPLPSGTVFDEYFDRMIEVVGQMKTPKTGMALMVSPFNCEDVLKGSVVCALQSQMISEAPQHVQLLQKTQPMARRWKLKTKMTRMTTKVTTPNLAKAPHLHPQRK